MRPHDPPLLAVHQPDVRTYVITVSGRLDRGGAARLTRLVDARLQLLGLGQCATNRLLIDLGGAQTIEQDALAALQHVREACDRRSVALVLIGVEHLVPRMSTHEGGELLRFPRAPTVAAADTSET